MPTIRRPDVYGPDYEADLKIDTRESGQLMRCKMFEMAVYGDVAVVDRKESRRFSRPGWCSPANLHVINGSSE